jgi:hypothetical protein
VGAKRAAPIPAGWKRIPQAKYRNAEDYAWLDTRNGEWRTGPLPQTVKDATAGRPTSLKFVTIKKKL